MEQGIRRYGPLAGRVKRDKSWLNRQLLNIASHNYHSITSGIPECLIKKEKRSFTIFQSSVELQNNTSGRQDLSLDER